MIWRSSDLEKFWSVEAVTSDDLQKFWHEMICRMQQALWAGTQAKDRTNKVTGYDLPWCAVTVATHLESPPWCWHWSRQSLHAWWQASARSHSRHSYGTSRCTDPSSVRPSGSWEPLKPCDTTVRGDTWGRFSALYWRYTSGYSLFF